MLNDARELRKRQPAIAPTGGGRPLQVQSIPVMPTTSAASSAHRDKDAEQPTGYFTCVAEPINMSDALRIPAAREAIHKEWDKLAAQRCWLLESVTEQDEVRAAAIKSRKPVHFGHITPLCVRMHSELAEQFHTYKGRVVFRGDNVRDQDDNHAVFQDITSYTSLLASSRMLDTIGLMPNHVCEQSDAPGAFTQAELQGYVETWVYLPRNMQPDSWRKYRRPVCKLRLALYGHPLSGCFWEQKVMKSLLAEGFSKVQEWECAYPHKTLKVFLFIVRG